MVKVSMPLHPQAQTFVDLIAAQNSPAWHELPVEESRKIFSTFSYFFGDPPDVYEVQNRDLEGVPVRIYRPKAEERTPVLMYFHGGGWVIGNLDTHDTLCRHIARESGFVVIAVDYRLAPDHAYPAALDDCYTATNFVSSHASELDVDASRLVVAGDSAGGNLAAAVSLKARDDGTANIRHQVLIYPVVERDFDTGSYTSFATGHGLTRETMQWFWSQYLGGCDPASDLRYVDLSLADLSALPPTHVITAEFDVLRDEGEALAARLSSAGVRTTSTRYDGMLHAFVHFSGFFDDGLVAIREVAGIVRNAVA